MVLPAVPVTLSRLRLGGWRNYRFAAAGMPSEGKSMEKPKGAAKTEGTAETEGKAGATPEGKAGATTEGKAGATAEGGAKGEGKAGKSVRLESQQVGKVRTYFSEHRPSVKSISKTEVSVSKSVLPSLALSPCMICLLTSLWSRAAAQSDTSSGATTSCSSTPAQGMWLRSSSGSLSSRKKVS
jgi:hypothetical protein